MKQKIIKNLGVILLSTGLVTGLFSALPASKAQARQTDDRYTVRFEQEDDTCLVHLDNNSDKVFKYGRVKVSGNNKLEVRSEDYLDVAPGDSLPFHVYVRTDEVPSEPSEEVTEEETTEPSEPEATAAPSNSEEERQETTAPSKTEESLKPSVSEQDTSEPSSAPSGNTEAKEEEAEAAKTGQPGHWHALALVLILSGLLLMLAADKKGRKRYMALFITAALLLPLSSFKVHAKETEWIDYSFEHEVSYLGVTEELHFDLRFQLAEQSTETDDGYNLSKYIEEEIVPAAVVYLPAEEEVGYKEKIREASDGLLHHLSYPHDERADETCVIKEVSDESWAVGVLDTRRDAIPFERKEIQDAEQWDNYRAVQEKGADGVRQTVKTYTVDPETGTLSTEPAKTESRVIEAPRDEIVVVGSREPAWREVNVRERPLTLSRPLISAGKTLRP